MDVHEFMSLHCVLCIITGINHFIATDCSVCVSYILHCAPLCYITIHWKANGHLLAFKMFGIDLRKNAGILKIFLSCVMGVREWPQTTMDFYKSIYLIQALIPGLLIVENSHSFLPSSLQN